MKRFLTGVISLLFLFLGNLAHAKVIKLTLKNFSSPDHDPGDYFKQYLVGTFKYNLGDQKILAASICGTWGNSISATTANNLLYLDNILIANSRIANPNPTYYPYVPWSYIFNDFSTLEDGIAVFSAIQTSDNNLSLGAANLFIETGPPTFLKTSPIPTPEPASFLLIGGGLIGLTKWGKKKKS